VRQGIAKLAPGAAAVVGPGCSYPSDLTAPRTPQKTGPGGRILSRTATFVLTCDDNISAFQCRFDGGAWKACGSTLTRSVPSRGGHTLAVRAIDRAGKIDATPATRTDTVA
jgi:large repetitive protein